MDTFQNRPGAGLSFIDDLPAPQPRKPTNLNTRVDTATRERLRQAAQSAGLSQSDLIRHFLVQGLDALEATEQTH